MLLTNSKGATLILENQALSTNTTNLAWTYEGPIGILDDEDVFHNQIAAYDDYYDLFLSPNDTRDVCEKKRLLKKLDRLKALSNLGYFAMSLKKLY